MQCRKDSRYLCGKGTIHFWKNFAFEQEGHPYIRVTHDISIEDVLTIFTRDWKLTLPRIVLVIISSLTTWQEWGARRQLENFKEGLIKAANTTAMWILTNGINTGIAKEIGSRVNEELVQRLIMRCHRHPHTDFEKRPPLCLLGIVREDLLTCADKFEANKGTGTAKLQTCRRSARPRSRSSRSSARGAPAATRWFWSTSKRQIPVLVLQGSGGVADLLALAYNEIDRRGVTLWDPEFIETVLKPEISSRICQMFPKFRDNALSRNVFKDRIIECLRLACQTHDQMYFTVINIHHHRNNLFHLDDILLKAVFKSQMRRHQAHQIKKDLLLTLDWNCPQMAKTKVFSKDFAEQYQIDREDFEYALLRPKREEFLHIFLNRGFQIHKQFATMATGVLNLCYLDSTCNRKFISHPCCQKWLTNEFFGRISIRDITWGFFGVPLWLKVTLCAFTVFPMYIWVRFKNDPHQMEYFEDAGTKQVLQITPPRNHLSAMQSLAFFYRSCSKGDRYDTGVTAAQEGIFMHTDTPVYKMMNLMWTAPITKFWVYQLFYVLFLGTLSIAVLWPSCGNMVLDTVCVLWIFLIGFETIDRTYRLHHSNTNIPLGSKYVEVVLLMMFGTAYLWSRLLRFGMFEEPYNGRVLTCLCLLYFYYRQTLIYLPISPQLGPVLYTVKLMVFRDFANFMRMALLVILSGGIVLHAILYPDYPITVELFRRVFHKAWFSLFLTPITDLEDSDTSCPNAGVWPYVFAVLYFVHLKLILLTVLYALFSTTATDVEPESDAIWKFQRYELVMDFAMRRCLPPPLNAITYAWLAMHGLFALCVRTVRRKKGDTYFMVQDTTKGQKLSDRDYRYWKQKALEYSNSLESANVNTAEMQAEKYAKFPIRVTPASEAKMSNEDLCYGEQGGRERSA
ncbi:hypothetical protein HPB48_019683 [Haemaphysalis longicornis]|uniref:TRPM SLOG domain-containing protein n=1 Tax=Haemaphysalis longicornis TaxID=44386 RepID=A0A9J6FTN9_HAELO|nr:hypothetical protein HPB48_019683 [Haemaphysalis longicornis]